MISRDFQRLKQFPKITKDYQRLPKITRDIQRFLEITKDNQRLENQKFGNLW